jgi:hypothetical protein
MIETTSMHLTDKFDQLLGIKLKQYGTQKLIFTRNNKVKFLINDYERAFNFICLRSKHFHNFKIKRILNNCDKIACVYKKYRIKKISH